MHLRIATTITSISHKNSINLPTFCDADEEVRFWTAGTRIIMKYTVYFLGTRANAQLVSQFKYRTLYMQSHEIY